MVELFANSGDPDQMLHSSVSDLGLHCLPVTYFRCLQSSIYNIQTLTFMLRLWVNLSAKDIFKHFSSFPQKTEFSISCILSPRQCQILFFFFFIFEISHEDNLNEMSSLTLCVMSNLSLCEKQNKKKKKKNVHYFL